MKEHPILFSGPMVRAILDGKKTQTRRVIKPQPDFISGDGRECGVKRSITVHDGRNFVEQWADPETGAPHARLLTCPYGAVGDLLVPAMLLEGYDCRYCADVYGRIWSKASGEWRELKSRETDGYLRLTLRKGGRDVNRTVHTLVCEAFYGPCQFPKGAARHLNHNSHDNTPDNLDWGTYQQNWDDRKKARHGINESHHASKLTMPIARTMRSSGKTAWALAKEYGVDPKTVQRVLKGETWKESYPEPLVNMPRWASRITLEITEVRVQRLQDINLMDAIAEGCGYVPPILPDVDPGEDPRREFETLWDSINGKRKGCSWADNPWCWAISFRRVQP